MQLISSFGKFRQQPLAGLGGKAVGHPHQVSLLALRGFDHFIDRHRRTEENCAPALGFRQAQEVHHAGNVHTFPQCCGYDCLRQSASISVSYLPHRGSIFVFD